MKTGYKRIVVKVGSNVLAAKDASLDASTLENIVDQIAGLRNAGIEVILVSSGAVACGRSIVRNAGLL